MESNFFSGSENLYKYLVSIGILMLVLTIYYPLREKQQLEILKINLQSELKILNFELSQNKNDVVELKNSINEKNIDSHKKNKLIFELSKNQKINTIKQFKADEKAIEIKSRERYVSIYDSLFWAFIVAGSVLVIFGFFKWYKSKKVDDEKCKIEVEMLKLKLAQERLNNTNVTTAPSNTSTDASNPTSNPSSSAIP